MYSSKSGKDIAKFQKNHEEKGNNLEKWSTYQRHLKKVGKLDAVREDRLQELGFVWNINDDNQQWEKWEDMFFLLVQFKEREGHYNVPPSHVESGINLGCWLQRQKNLKNIGKLDSANQDQLEKLCFIWKVYNKKWKDLFTLLSQVKGVADQKNVDQESYQILKDYKILEDNFLRLMCILSAREQVIIRMRLGLDDGKVRTLEEISRHLSVEKECIRQFQSTAQEKLQQHVKSIQHEIILTS